MSKMKQEAEEKIFYKMQNLALNLNKKGFLLQIFSEIDLKIQIYPHKIHQTKVKTTINQDLSIIKIQEDNLFKEMSMRLEEADRHLADK